MNYTWKKLDLDTALFGYPIAKIESVSSTTSLNGLIDDLRQNLIQYASYRVPTDNAEMVQALQESEFRLIDSLIAMEINLENFESLIDSVHVRAAKKSDENRLYEIASESFTTNRFYADNYFSEKKDQIKKLYGTWAKNSLSGDAADCVFVFEQEKIVFGFATVQNSGHIPLIAVSREMRGKGISKVLLYSCLEYLQGKKRKLAQIEAVIMNVPALRTYQSMGFKIVGSSYTFAWRNNDTHILH